VIASTASVESEPVSVTVTYRESVAPAGKPRLFVAAVGVSKYAEDRFNLQFADRDAQDFAAVWPSQKGLLYRDVLVRVIVNEEAIRANVLDVMDWLVKAPLPEDVAVLFLSGHGVSDDRQNYYFAAHDMRPERLRATAVSWTEVMRMTLDRKSRKFLLFVDTCRGGGATGGSNISIDPMRELPKQDAGAILFAGCTPYARALEQPDWGHGAFTHALLETFASADSDLDKPRDGRLSIDELTQNLNSRVQRLTGGRQVPVVGRPPTITNFNIFHFP
jgi:uncharacterized caspase-like protein